MSQNRKRPHDQAGGATSNGDSAQITNGSGSNDSSPQSKRTLITNSHSNLNNIAQNGKANATAIAATANAISSKTGTNNATAATKQTVRVSQKSHKPMQSINRVNAPEDIYYHINVHLNQLRHDLQITALRKLARKPYKPLASEYQKLYQTFGKLSEKAAAAAALNVPAKAVVDAKIVDEPKPDSDEVMAIDEKSSQNAKAASDDVVIEEEEDAEKKMSQASSDPAPDSVKKDEAVSGEETAPAPTVVLD